MEKIEVYLVDDWKGLENVPVGGKVLFQRGGDVEHMAYFGEFDGARRYISRGKEGIEEINLRSSDDVAFRKGVIHPLTHQTKHLRNLYEGNAGYDERKRLLLMGDLR